MAEAIDGRGGSKRPGRTARAWTGAMALAAVALLLQLPAPVVWAGGITSAAPTGPLKIYARITLPSTAGEMFSSAAPAEAPDGAVFMASVTNNDNTVVWVVDGDGPATVAEHVSGVVHALAVGTDNLYVATYTALTAFNRQTGNRVESWALPKFSTANVSDNDLVAVSAFNGEVLISIVMGNQIDIYHVNAASSAGLKLIAIGTSSALGLMGSSISCTLASWSVSVLMERQRLAPRWPTTRTAWAGAFSTSMPSPEAWFGSSSLRAKVRMPP